MCKFGYISPIESRQLTYDILELADKEKWDVVINDCSNEQKFYRGIQKFLALENIGYKKEMKLPENWFNNRVNKLKENEIDQVLKLYNSKE